MLCLSADAVHAMQPWPLHAQSLHLQFTFKIALFVER